MVVLLVLLGNIRAGLVVALAIPLSMLFAATGMVHAGISGNLMSLGAIDFGLIVDGAVVMIENGVRRRGERAASAAIEQRGAARRRTRSARPVAVRRRDHHHRLPADPRLQGVEGKMFRPMALTVIFALVALAGAHADADAGAGVASAPAQARCPSTTAG